MKKAIIISSLLSTMLLADTVEIKTGWNNVGFSAEYGVQDLAESSQSLKQFWYFDPVSKSWSFFSTNDSLMQTANSSGYSQIPQTLPFGSGVWIYSDSNVSVSVESSSFYTDNSFGSISQTYYDNTQYAIGSKEKLPYIATSTNGSDWANFVAIDLNKDNQIMNNWSAQIFARGENDLIFSFVTYDSNNSSARSGWVGSFENGVVTSLQNVVATSSGDVYNWYGIFTSPESNSTQYIFFKKYDWGDESDEVVVATKVAEGQWSVLNIENGQDIEANYDYIYRDNADSLRVLRGFKVATYAPYKTLIYRIDSGLHKSLELDGVWSSLTTFDDADVRYTIMAKSDYADWRRGGKHLAVLTNGSSVDYVDLDHIVRAVGVVYLNESRELFAFAQDEIGGNLYVYKSVDLGKSWSLFKEVADFGYQINYISSINKKDDGTIYCKLYVDYYNKYVESNDSFASWSVVTESYRVVGANANESGKYIERIEPNGSITLIERR